MHARATLFAVALTALFTLPSCTTNPTGNNNNDNNNNNVNTNDDGTNDNDDNDDNINDNNNDNDDAGNDTLATFQDPDSDFSTTDVADVNGDVVRFDADNARMIWVRDDLQFDNFDVNGNLIDDGFFTIRFGTENGMRMAYFTETNPPTICDINVIAGQLSIRSTNETVPQE